MFLIYISLAYEVKIFSGKPGKSGNGSKKLSIYAAFSVSRF